MEEFKVLNKTSVLSEAYSSAADSAPTSATSASASEDMAALPSLHLSLALICFADLKARRVVFWAAFPSNSLEYTCQECPAGSPCDMSIPGTCVVSGDTAQLPWHTRNALHNFRQSNPNARSAILGFESGKALQFLWKGVLISPVPLVGWMPDSKGRMLPRQVRVGQGDSPTMLSKQASDLNLALMKWQAAPHAQLERLASCRVLLLGAGTLGCNVARGLLGWGVRDITLVDNGSVSMSNPTRQPLFTFDDALKRAPKAATAAAALKAIQPAANVRGVHFSIPMPGHHNTQSQGDMMQQVQELQEIIHSSDVVFLLTDSRESRWLPTVLCSLSSVPLINVALGFDTCLIIRHGMPLSSKTDAAHTGCYFCADIVAPTDSSGNRTLDQQCTVTRPGLAAWASAMAVELMVNTLHHEEGFSAAAGAAGCMGDVPHTLRCDVSTFRVQQLETHAFPNCSACSQPMRRVVDEGGVPVLADMLTGTASISQLCGLDAYYAQAAAAAEGWQDDDLDWE